MESQQGSTTSGQDTESGGGRKEGGEGQEPQVSQE